MPKAVGNIDTRRPIISKLISPFEEFFQKQSSAGVLLLIAAAAALILANSAFSSWYFSLRDGAIHISLPGLTAHSTIQHLINDGLMTLFFLSVGLEIKRELFVGELRSLRRAALPVAAAIGGMVVPAVIFAVLNHSSNTLQGWAIPMATDIAFALGILSLLGSKVPLSARIFLTSLAIIDDLGAISVIALFYSSGLMILHLAFAALCCVTLLTVNRMGVQSLVPYSILGFLLWLSLTGSGIHPTIAGVVLASAIPVVSKIDPQKFEQISQLKLQQFTRATAASESELLDVRQEEAIHELELVIDQVRPPMYRLQHMLHNIASILIMPLFAFFNAGIVLSSASLNLNPLTSGIIAGLCIGKPVGILISCWLAIKAGWAIKSDLSLTQSIGVSCLAGIGFTMSLFIANLAFKADSAVLLNSTAAILLGSAASACVGIALLWSARTKSVTPDQIDCPVHSRVCADTTSID